MTAEYEKETPAESAPSPATPPGQLLLACSGCDTGIKRSRHDPLCQLCVRRLSETYGIPEGIAAQADIAEKARPAYAAKNAQFASTPVRDQVRVLVLAANPDANLDGITDLERERAAWMAKNYEALGWRPGGGF